MHPQFSFDVFEFKNISIFKVLDPSDNSEKLADLVSTLDDGCVVGFERNIWSILTCGQMPSQLFPFKKLSSTKTSPEPITDSIVVFSANESEDAFSQIDFLEKIHSFTGLKVINQAGELGESYEYEEDFIGGLYGLLQTWDYHAESLPEVPNIKNFWLKSSSAIQLCVGNNLSVADDWLEEFWGLYGEPNEILNSSVAKSGLYFYIPSKELLKDLPERVNDKERVHLDDEIRGVHL